MYEYHYKMQKHGLDIHKGKGESGNTGWLDGYVFTEHGVVSVYTQGGDSTTKITELRFYNGLDVYVKNFKKRTSKRGLVTLAKRYAKEMAQKFQEK